MAGRKRTGGADEPGATDFDDEDPRPSRGRKKRTTKGGSKAPKTRSGLWMRRLLGVFLLLGLLGAGTVVGAYIYFGSDPNLPDFKKLSDYRPQQITRVLDRHGRTIGYLGGPERRTVIPFAAISKNLVQGIVAAEDPSYWQHEGVDYRGILRAAVDNTLQARWGKRAQGGSTITQQVVKMLLLSPEKSYRRKIQELILARRLSQQLSKEDVLAIYLNNANFGHGNYGCQEAARFYFDKDAGDLTVGEAAFMAGVPQLPERHSPHRHPESAKARQRYVLAQMARHGYIDQATADKFATAPIEVQDPSNAEAGHAPEAVAVAYKHMVDTVGAAALPTLGTTIKTTIDLDLQQNAREAIERGLEELDRRQGYRGPLSHLEGKALERHRAALVKARPTTLREGEIVEGIVEKVQGQRLSVDVGPAVGVVDLTREGRYSAADPNRTAKTPPAKPLSERFRSGDVVRVRLAPERRRADSDDKLPLALELGPQAAMVVMDPQTKEIRAMVGGYGFRAGGFDRAQRALRQPGSSFKPFLYAAAIDSRKFTAASIVNDAPEVYDTVGDQDWIPQNYDKDKFAGPVRLRRALAESMNTVAVKVAADVGVPAIIQYAQRCGITTPFSPQVGLSLALGTNSVAPIELANAYSTLAAGGQWAPPWLVSSVGDKETPRPTFEARLSPETAFVMVSMLRSVVDEGTARAAGAALKRPLAGKTGTSNTRKHGTLDAWFVGFAPDLLAAVWIGFDDMRALGRGESGARSAVPVWTAFMSKALAARPVQDFASPPGITVARIDPVTGGLAEPGAPGIDEVFLEGTVPVAAEGAGPEAQKADQLLLEGTPQ